MDEEEDIEKDEEAEVKGGDNKLLRYKKDEKLGKSSSVSRKKKSSSFNSAKRVIDKKVLVPTILIVKSSR